MNKLLLTSAAVCGFAMIATPAAAQLELELGGHFKGYGAYVDQDEVAGSEVNDFDFIRNTEIHFGAETTLDNGLTIGFHSEAEVDASQDADTNGDGNIDVSGDGFNIDESYVYFSGGWGRINAGDEDGAQYLLQVAAPSADSNIDGIRQFVNPVNFTSLGGAALAGAASIGAQNSGGIDYDADASGKSTKLTYLSPLFSGFQIGASYSPDTDAATENGIGLDNQEDVIGETYEVAARYEGNFSGVGVILGAGYSYGENEADNPLVGIDSDDRTQWNVGADFDIGPFGLGAVYTEDDGGVEGVGADDEETFVVGADYTTGPFKLGASYFTQDNSFAVDGLDTERYSGGVTYTYGPGMTFRGSVGYIEHDIGAADVDATYVTLGTQINF